jgi:hypothetical protein
VVFVVNAVNVPKQVNRIHRKTWNVMRHHPPPLSNTFLILLYSAGGEPFLIIFRVDMTPGRIVPHQQFTT